MRRSSSRIRGRRRRLRRSDAECTECANAPDAPQAPKSPAQQFPYPGEQPAGSLRLSSGDVKPAPPGGLQDAGSSGAVRVSSSSDSGYSSSNADNAPASPDADDTSVPTKTRSSRRNLKAEPVKTSSQQFDEDLQVAAFYQNDGNFMGAYMRAKDAVSISADNPDARLALADAARKLGKLDEAEQNYKKCLQLDPVPKTKKAARGGAEGDDRRRLGVRAAEECWWIFGEWARGFARGLG